MISVAITGQSGFLGSHLFKAFGETGRHTLIPLERDFFPSIASLPDGTYLIHCASVHRDPNPETVYTLNMDLHRRLLDVFRENNKRFNIVFLSSIQESMNNPYGRSKKDGKELFFSYCNEVQTIFISHSLPNVFGPGAKPNRTSFIATFCYNIQRGIPCHYNSNMVNLIYIDDVVSEIVSLDPKRNQFLSNPVRVSDVYYTLQRFKNELDKNQNAVVAQGFEANLLTTFLYYRTYNLK